MWKCRKCENINSDESDKCFICGYALSSSIAKEREIHEYTPVKSVEPMYYQTSSIFKENRDEAEEFYRRYELSRKKKLKQFLIPFFITDAVIIAVIIYLLFDGGIL